MKNTQTTNQETKVEIGDFGPIYRQFVGKPQKAIPIKHKGYGLSHIIDKHEEGIKRLGFRIEDFIPIIVQFGSIKESDSKEEFLFESNYYRIVVEKRFKGREKQ